MVKPEKPTVLNLQVPEAYDIKHDNMLDFHSMFHTLQGEGPLAGTPSIFIRLAGCNLQCPFCDTEYTLGRRRRTVPEIVDKALVFGKTHKYTKLVVLTGGEPTRQNIEPLIYALMVEGFHVQIESNGVLAPPTKFLYWLKDKLVTYIVSPKTHKIHPDTKWASAFKYVISADSLREGDGLPIMALGHKAKPFIARPPKDYEGKVYVNPMDANDPVANKANLMACRDSALKHGYIMGIQMHKLLELE